jgi:hypothetical protein
MGGDETRDSEVERLERCREEPLMIASLEGRARQGESRERARAVRVSACLCCVPPFLFLTGQSL